MSRKQWVSRADEGLSAWAIWKLQPESTTTRIGYPRSSPITRAGMAVDHIDRCNQDHTPDVKGRPWMCGVVQSALDVMPAPLAEVLVALWLLPDSQRAIADELGISFDTMRKRKMQGLLFLEGWLESSQYSRA
jgi:hypothetical protein